MIRETIVSMIGITLMLLAPLFALGAVMSGSFFALVAAGFCALVSLQLWFVARAIRQDAEAERADSVKRACRELERAEGGGR